VKDYEAESKIFRVLSDPTRLKILDMLSCKEMCACNVLDSLSISQSTLSHHMKALMDCGLVTGRKESTWMYYTIRQERVGNLHQTIDELTQPKEDCICDSSPKACDA